VETGTSRGVLWPHTTPVRCTAFSHDGAALAAGAQDGALRLFSLETGRSILDVRDGGVLLSIRMHPDGERMVTGSLDGTIRIRSLATAEILGTITADDTRVIDLGISADGSLLAAASMSGKLRLWSLAALELVQEADAYALGLAFPPGADASRLWLGRSGALSLMDVQRGLQAEVLSLNKGGVRNLSWIADGGSLSGVNYICRSAQRTASVSQGTTRTWMATSARRSWPCTRFWA
jgi:WD40 repeat protein